MRFFSSTTAHRGGVSMPFGAIAVVGAVVLAGCSSSVASSTATTSASGLQVSGTASGWVFHDGQTVKVAMAPNKIFTPYLRLDIIMCANPGGTKAHLPTSLADCDANTIQGDSVVPAKDGSFSESAYTIYRLPSVALGENKSTRPICDSTSQCVLFVGQDYNNFKRPKVFSQPFTVTAGIGS